MTSTFPPCLFDLQPAPYARCASYIWFSLHIGVFNLCAARDDFYLRSRTEYVAQIVRVYAVCVGVWFFCHMTLPEPVHWYCSTGSSICCRKSSVCMGRCINMSHGNICHCWKEKTILFFHCIRLKNKTKQKQTYQIMLVFPGPINYLCLSISDFELIDGWVHSSMSQKKAIGTYLSQRPTFPVTFGSWLVEFSHVAVKWVHAVVSQVCLFSVFFGLEQPYCTVYDRVHTYMHLCALMWKWCGIIISWLLKKM